MEDIIITNEENPCVINKDSSKTNLELKSCEGVPVIHFSQDHKFRLDEAALESILLQPEVKDRYVVVVSVAGAFRKGKSFILDYFIRYLKAKYGKNRLNGKQCYDWMGQEQEPLTGFTWKGGSDRDTTGIIIWPEVFLTTLPPNDKVAIILLDTQGTFDSTSTVKDCATVFALSTMVSSLQVYNLSQNIQEDDLQHLQLFTEYGKMALQQSGTKPFQKLEFLVRDWSYPYDAEYGEVGGQKLLDKRLEVSEDQHIELQTIRNHIYSCFSEIECFLMPHPGLKMATNPKFDGRLADIDPLFKKYLRKFVCMLLSPENLVLKEINGQKVRAKELVQYFKSYVDIYSGDDLPEPKSMLEATAQANNLSAVAEAKEAYNLMMEGSCGASKPYLNSSQLEQEHLKIKYQALNIFDKKKKMGGEQFSEDYRQKLETALDELFVQFKQHNESKNLFNAAKTPSVLSSIIVASYILSSVFSFLGLYNLANICHLCMGFSLTTLIAWAYIRYSGEMIELGEKIEEVTFYLWEYLLKSIYHSLINTKNEQKILLETEKSTMKEKEKKNI